jgi:hypothetical protein
MKTTSISIEISSSGESYSGTSQLYRELDGFLNPASPPRQFDGYLLKALWNIGRFGYSKLKYRVPNNRQIEHSDCRDVALLRPH